MINVLHRRKEVINADFDLHRLIFLNLTQIFIILYLSQSLVFQPLANLNGQTLSSTLTLMGFSSCNCVS